MSERNLDERINMKFSANFVKSGSENAEGLTRVYTNVITVKSFTVR
jgi:hypothetical protein